MNNPTLSYEANLEFARKMDAKDPLADFRNQFHHPVRENGSPYLYFTGNSLGLQPKATSGALEQELLDWQRLGVEGHFHAKNPWMPYHEFLTEAMAEVVGANQLKW